MSSKKKPLCVAEKISDLITCVPTSFGSDDEAEETKAKVVDFDDEIDNDDGDTGFDKSRIRKRNLNLLEEIDTRYKGKKVSKREIFNDGFSSEEDHESHEDDDGVSVENSNLDSNASSDEEDGVSGDEESENGSEKSDDDEFGDGIDLTNPLRRSRTDTIKTVSTTNTRSEIEKGNCVRQQLKLWESLLEMRIKMQKCLSASNKLPQSDVYKDYACNDQFNRDCDSTKRELNNLLCNLLDLQDNLLKQYPETSKGLLLQGQKRKAHNDNTVDQREDSMDEEIPSDTDEEMNDEEEDSDNVESSEKEGQQAKKKMKLRDIEKKLSLNHKAYSSYRNSVIQKWNDKTRIASGVIQKGVHQPAIKQIEFALANREKLIKKTQLKRSEYDVVGKAASLGEIDGRRSQDYDAEIYDDDDFYHQLLRELIEYKSADTTDPIALSRQWVQLQNMRSKMKRKIDTRATKGRRIRYNVHQKLVNFMAPITVNDTYTDRAKDELYSSLFGKIKASSEEGQA